MSLLKLSKIVKSKQHRVKSEGLFWIKLDKKLSPADSHYRLTPQNLK